jgi:flagellar basal-body rod protein FlgG
MIENLSTAAAGMLAQQRRIAAVANDLTNVSTTGYKHQRQSFRDLVYVDAGRSQTGGVRTGTGAMVEDAGRSFQQGELSMTDRSLDVAIQGDGFLRIRFPDGRQGLTRDGSLHLDASGSLVTGTGARVQPGISFPPGTSEDSIAIGPDGTVKVGDRRVGRVDVVVVRAPNALLATGDNAFELTTASGPATRVGKSTTLIQGALEGSNVDSADEMVEMIDAQRAYQLAAKAITNTDEMMSIANGIRR